MLLPKNGVLVLAQLWLAAGASAALPFIASGAFATATLTPEARADAPLGDRLVVAVNGVPYTQRQVESYVLVKESLRKEAMTRVLGARDWSEALAAFAEDMTVLQESERLGSFQTEGALLEKYRTQLDARIAAGASLKAAVRRLDMANTELSRTLEGVLRVAAFRHGKDHTPGSANATPARDGEGRSGSVPRWLEDLTARTVIRYFEDASRFQAIAPELAQEAHAR